MSFQSKRVPLIGGLLVLAIVFYAMHLLGKSTMLNIQTLNAQAEKLLGYNPSSELIQDTRDRSHVMITCHGCGANKQIGHSVAPNVAMPVLTFNFPDHDIDENFDVYTSTFGTFDEYVPLIYLLKACVTSGISTISLYGFSAGGGAIITTLSILNNPAYTDKLTRIGVGKEEVEVILQAISRGTILLDAPLKSVREILSIRPNDHMIQVLAPRYKANRFEPIDCIEQLKGLTLSILVYFEQDDKILSNRDDELYYQKLCSVNKDGKNELVVGRDGGHNGFHKKLWAAYKKFS